MRWTSKGSSAWRGGWFLRSPVCWEETCLAWLMAPGVGFCQSVLAPHPNPRARDHQPSGTARPVPGQVALGTEVG